ncbi:MAG: PD-(D/E)XK nuclease family protein, partial [Candidatus Bipolaricaulia bacterium]
DIRLVWHYLRHDEELVSTRTPQEIERLERDIVRRVRAIEAAVDFPAQESPLCAWCDYLAVCPAKGHSLAVAALSPNEFRAEPGVNLVNRLAELRTTLKTATAAAEDEIVGVEEALLAYARQHGYTVVVGDEMEAVIDDSADLLLPRKDDPRRPALEDAVRQLGLWDTVSDLSLSKLEKTLAENAIPLDARRRIERFAATEPKTTLRLRKRRAAADR